MTDRETPAGAVEALATALHEWVDFDGKPDAPCAYCNGVPHKPDCIVMRHRALLALTRSVDVERWQRIETAARLVADAIDSKDAVNIWGWSRALRNALREVR